MILHSVTEHLAIGAVDSAIHGKVSDLLALVTRMNEITHINNMSLLSTASTQSGETVVGDVSILVALGTLGSAAAFIKVSLLSASVAGHERARKDVMVSIVLAILAIFCSKGWYGGCSGIFNSAHI